MQSQVDLEESDSSSDSQKHLSRAAILAATSEAHLMPTSDEEEPSVPRSRPKVWGPNEYYPQRSLAEYDQQTLSCGLFAQYEKWIAHETDVYKIGDSLPNEEPKLGRRPPTKQFLTHVIEQIKATPSILESQTLLILSDTHNLEDIAHWKHTARWIVDRTTYVGPNGDKWLALFIPSHLFPCHFVWTATYILKALVPFLPKTDLVLLDHDAAFTKNKQLTN